MLMSAFLITFKANYLEKCVATSSVSSWIPKSLFPRGPNMVQKPLYLVGTVLKPCNVYKVGVFLQGCLATNVHDEVTTHRMYHA